jgi:toxin ParE1/3/4
MKPIVFAPEAQAEFEAAVEWYEAKAVGLGERFVSHVDDVLQLVEETPAGFPKWNVDLRFRRAVVQRFPYVVFYRDLGDRIEVVAVAHGAREPGYWLERR